MVRFCKHNFQPSQSHQNLALAVNRQPWLPPGTRRAFLPSSGLQAKTNMISKRALTTYMCRRIFQAYLIFRPLIASLGHSVRCSRSFCVDRHATELYSSPKGRDEFEKPPDTKNAKLYKSIFSTNFQGSARFEHSRGSRSMSRMPLLRFECTRHA